MYTRQDVPNISRPIFYSAIGHLVLIIILCVVPSIKRTFSDKPLQMVWVELPRGTSEDIGTGMKKSEALPKSTIQEQKDLLNPKAEIDKKTMKEPEKDKDKKKKKKEKRPVKKKSKESAALAKIDKLLKKRVIQPEAAQLKDGGEGFKYGTSDEPLRVPIDDPEYVKYQAMIRSKIIQEWIVPMKYGEMPEGTRPKSRVIVMINEGGEVISTQWERRSGDASFDSSCVRAIQRASPFDEPIERLKWEAYNEGFLVEFDPRLKP